MQHLLVAFYLQQEVRSNLLELVKNRLLGMQGI